MAADLEAAPTTSQVLSRCNFQAGGAARAWLLLQSDGLYTQVTCQHSNKWGDPSSCIVTDSTHGCTEMQQKTCALQTDLSELDHQV